MYLKVSLSVVYLFFSSLSFAENNIEENINTQDNQYASSQADSKRENPIRENPDQEDPKKGIFSSVFNKALEKFSLKESEEDEGIIENIKVSPPQAPRPFNIIYKVSFNGLPTGLKANAKLRKHENNYLFELTAKNWVLSYREKSAFSWHKESPCNLLTEKYQFNFEGFGETESFEVEINQEKFVANSQTQKGNYQYEVPSNVSDALAYLFKLQCDLKNNQLNPNYNIAYDKGIDHYVFKYVGKDVIRTSLGKIETIILERVYKNDHIQTTYWIAPSVDYLMVKMKHKQGRIVTATLKIKSIDYNIKTEIDDLKDKDTNNK
jgi:hypothetical protein